MMTAREATAETVLEIPVCAGASRVAAVQADERARRAAVVAEFRALKARLAGRVEAYIAG